MHNFFKNHIGKYLYLNDDTIKIKLNSIEFEKHYIIINNCISIYYDTYEFQIGGILELYDCDDNLTTTITKHSIF